jgi:hypothetical protein
MAVRRLVSMIVSGLIIAAPWYALRTGLLTIPDEWNPWAPLSLEQPLGWTTRFKLARVSRDDAMCLAVLEQSGIRYEPVADRAIAPGCGFDNAVRIRAIGSGRNGISVEPFTLTCRSAVSLALWERHIVQPAAHAYFDAPVTRLEHFGSYACRNIYSRKDAPLSRHATADAIDVAAFTLADGRRVRVDRDWRGHDVEALFLHDVHSGACRVFDSVLGPDYNAAHANHFHLDRGGFRVCR